MFLLVDLADHFQDSREGGFAVPAKDGIVVYEAGDGLQVLRDGPLVIEPLLRRGAFLLFHAGNQASAGQGELILVLVLGHGIDVAIHFDGDMTGVGPMEEVIGVA